MSSVALRINTSGYDIHRSLPTGAELNDVIERVARQEDADERSWIQYPLPSTALLSPEDLARTILSGLKTSPGAPYMNLLSVLFPRLTVRARGYTHARTELECAQAALASNENDITACKYGVSHVNTTLPDPLTYNAVLRANQRTAESQYEAAAQSRGVEIRQSLLNLQELGWALHNGMPRNGIQWIIGVWAAPLVELFDKFLNYADEYHVSNPDEEESTNVNIEDYRSKRIILAFENSANFELNFTHIDGAIQSIFDLLSGFQVKSRFYLNFLLLEVGIQRQVFEGWSEDEYFANVENLELTSAQKLSYFLLKGIANIVKERQQS